MIDDLEGRRGEFSWPPPYFFLWGHLEAEEDLLVRTVAMSAQYKVLQNTVRRCNACSKLQTALVHKLKIITLKILRAKYNQQTFMKTKQRTVKRLRSQKSAFADCLISQPQQGRLFRHGLVAYLELPNIPATVGTPTSAWRCCLSRIA